MNPTPRGYARPVSPALLGKVLFWGAAAFVLPGLLGLPRDGEALWEDGLVLFIPGGALLILYGVLSFFGVARMRRRTIISGTWLFALGWPLFLLWALGVVDP